MKEKVCGNCRWRFTMARSLEMDGLGNCYAMPSIRVESFISGPEARCIVPHLFEAKEEANEAGANSNQGCL